MSSIGRSLPHAGTYRRELPVSLERLYENALDWEHLPYLHRTTFSSIVCVDAGAWGWRAHVGLQPAGPDRTIVLELALDRACRRWITRTLAGPGAGTEIWTHAFAVDTRQTDIVVDFFVPDVDADALAKVGNFYCDLYAHLYDEDVWMMTERQARLDQRSPAPTDEFTPVTVGRRADLTFPLVVNAGGRPFRIVELDGELFAHAAVCPHLLGPLADAPVCGGIVECPWHGFRYDVRTGVEVSGRRHRLAPAPTVTCAGDIVMLRAPAP
jgi:nitrite reductase/ring-hydroxylating ferredoxin subunit